MGELQHPLSHQQYVFGTTYNAVIFAFNNLLIVKSTSLLLRPF